MPRAKLLFAACLAVLVVGAMATATASAAGNWMVNGTNITTAAEILPEVKVLEHGLLEVAAGETVTIKCEGGTTINGGKLVPTNGVEATSVTFEECLVAAGGCSLATKTIGTVPVDGEAVLAGVLDTLVTVLPKTKNTFATIKFEGALCSLAGIQPVTGKVHLYIHEGRHERLSHLVLAFSLAGGLKVGLNEASLHKIDGDVRLKNDLPWSFL